MGRSSAKTALQNRAKIVEAASRLFRGHGVETVSLAEIMAAAGLTNGGFYKHFGSKAALAQEAGALSFAQALGHWRKLNGGARDIVQLYFTARPPEATCPLLAYRPSRAAPTDCETIRAPYEAGAEALYDLFREAISPNGPSACDRDQAAAVLFAAMVGAKMISQATDDSDWSQSLRNAVLAYAAQLDPPADPPSSR